MLIIDTLLAIRQMPYYKNVQSSSGLVHGGGGHEAAICSVLIEQGYKKWEKWDTMPDKCRFRNLVRMREWIDTPSLSSMMPVGTFVEQPFGTNDAPDFYIKVTDNFIMPLEAKSSSNYIPMWNSGKPKPDFVYAFCSEKTDKTTLFKGESILSYEQSRMINEHIEKHRKDDEELNYKLKQLDINHRGISYYTRPMIQQSGGADFTNYFTHPNREQDEQLVFDWVTDKIKQT